MFEARVTKSIPEPVLARIVQPEPGVRNVRVVIVELNQTFGSIVVANSRQFPVRIDGLKCFVRLGYEANWIRHGQ